METKVEQLTDDLLLDEARRSGRHGDSEYLQDVLNALAIGVDWVSDECRDARLRVARSINDRRPITARKITMRQEDPRASF